MGSETEHTLERGEPSLTNEKSEKGSRVGVTPPPPPTRRRRLDDQCGYARPAVKAKSGDAPSGSTAIPSKEIRTTWKLWLSLIERAGHTPFPALMEDCDGNIADLSQHRISVPEVD